MTALPEREAHTSLLLNALLLSNTRRMASATAPPSRMAPSTIASGGTCSIPNAATRNPLPAGLSSTALTVLEPMSSPTTDLGLRNKGTDCSPGRPDPRHTWSAGSIDPRSACPADIANGSSPAEDAPYAHFQAGPLS